MPSSVIPPALPVVAWAGGSVVGALIIACFPTDAGCDEALTRTVTISGTGASALFNIEGLADGSYLLIAWQDGNGNGDMEEAELSIFGPGGEPTLLTPPTGGITFTLNAVPAAAAPTSSAIPAAITGGWFQGSSSPMHYYDPSNGAWAPPTGSGFRYTFAPDGSYEYSGILQSSTFGCTSTLFSYHRGSAAVNGQVLMLVPESEMFRSQDSCNVGFDNAFTQRNTKFMT
ncbi:MAG: hypothetical protein WD314_14760 [Trueperaceae bacterium]